MPFCKVRNCEFEAVVWSNAVGPYEEVSIFLCLLHYFVLRKWKWIRLNARAILQIDYYNRWELKE